MTWLGHNRMIVQIVITMKLNVFLSKYKSQVRASHEESTNELVVMGAPVQGGIEKKRKVN